MAGEKTDRNTVERAFREVERVTTLLRHPLIAPVSFCGRVDGEPVLEFDFPAIGDGHDVIEAMSTQGKKLPYGAADSYIYSLREALTATAFVTDPRTGEPVCLGRLGLSNMMFAADGRWALIGFGRNFPLEREDGTPDAAVPYQQAPELAMGGKPSPTGDYVALVLVMRSLLSWVDMSGSVGRIMRGELSPEDVELIMCLQWLEERMVGCIPAMRATVEEAVAVSHRIRELQGTTLEESAFRDFVRELFAQAEEPSPLEGDAVAMEEMAQTLTLGPDAAWVAAPDGARHRLGRAHRRILLALVEQYERARLQPLTIFDLLATGWPGESLIGDSGINRAYVSLTRLRQLGLRDVIERFDDGYRLAPTVRVQRAA